MKKRFKTWAFRLLFTGLFLFGLLVTFMLSPMFLYANKTTIGKYSIYHNKPLLSAFLLRLQQSNSVIKSSELYTNKLTMEVCLKDGSNYPALIEKVMGSDFISSFYNKVVFTGDEVNIDKNYIGLGGHKWNLTAMLSHAQVHCLEFDRYGLWNSNPVGRHPEWKWEGYPEYIARQDYGSKNLYANITTLLQAERQNKTGWMRMPDSTETLISYFRYRLLVQYCLEVNKMSFVKLLADTTSEQTVRQKMMAWYSEHQNYDAQ